MATEVIRQGSASRIVTLYLEGAIVNEVTCPEGVEVHVIDTSDDVTAMDRNDPSLCRCDEYGGGAEHQHVVWSHRGGETVQGYFCPRTEPG